MNNKLLLETFLFLLGSLTIASGLLMTDGSAPPRPESGIEFAITPLRIPTLTNVSCQQRSAYVNQTVKCTSQVTIDVSPAPTGLVSFSSSPQANLSPDTCSLVQVSNFTSACDVSFLGISVGSYNVTAFYSGDSHSFSSDGSSLVFLSSRIATSTSLTCSASSGIVAGIPISCTAGVVQKQGCEIFPCYVSGTVLFTSKGLPGDFSPSHTCILQFDNRTFAYECSVTFTSTPLSGGVVSINATYLGNVPMAPSSASVSVNFIARNTTSTMLECLPNPATAGGSVSCQVAVANTNTTATSFAPTGNVTFVTDALGTFSSQVCNFAPSLTPTPSGSVCTVTYYPGLHTGMHNLTAAYGGDSLHMPSKGLYSL